MSAESQVKGITDGMSSSSLAPVPDATAPGPNRTTRKGRKFRNEKKEEKKARNLKS